MVGPLNVKKDARPLPPDLEEFVMNTGGHGFIIVSFGSNVASVLPKTVVDMLATAFGKLKQRVVWRLQGSAVVINQPIINELVGGCICLLLIQWVDLPHGGSIRHWDCY